VSHTAREAVDILPSPFRSEPTLAPRDATPAALEPVRFILAGLDLAGFVEPQRRRMSDLLQHGDPVAFQPAIAGRAEWVSIDPSELLIVIPPPFVSPPEWRVQRQLHDVIVQADRYVVTGTAHLRPGEEVDPYLRSTRQFLPLTQASLSFDGQPPEPHETIIVNLKRVDQFRVI
jgi:hypothetical protein